MELQEVSFYRSDKVYVKLVKHIQASKTLSRINKEQVMPLLHKTFLSVWIALSTLKSTSIDSVLENCSEGANDPLDSFNNFECF